MENLHGIHLEHTFIFVSPNKDDPSALCGFIYLPSQTGLEDLDEKATFEEKRDRVATLEILNGTFAGRMTRRVGDEIGRCFPRLYPELWRPDAEEIEDIQERHKIAGAIPISVENLRNRIKEYGKMCGLEQQHEHLTSDMEAQTPRKQARAPNLRRKNVATPTQMTKPTDHRTPVKADAGRTKANVQNQSNTVPRDRPGAVSQHLALGDTSHRKRRHIVESSDDEVENDANRAKEKSAPAAKKQDNGSKVHGYSGGSHLKRRDAATRKRNVANLYADEEEDDEAVFKRLSADAKKNKHNNANREREMAQQAAAREEANARKEAYARSCSLAELATLLEKKDADSHNDRQIAGSKAAPVRPGSLATLMDRVENEQRYFDNARTASATKSAIGQHGAVAQLAARIDQDDRTPYISRQTTTHKQAFGGNGPMARSTLPFDESDMDFLDDDGDMVSTAIEQQNENLRLGIRAGGSSHASPRPKTIGKSGGGLPGKDNREERFGRPKSVSTRKTIPPPKTFGKPVGSISGEISKGNMPGNYFDRSPQSARSEYTGRSKSLTVEHDSDDELFYSEEPFYDKNVFAVEHDSDNENLHLEAIARTKETAALENDRNGELFHPKKVVGSKKVFVIDYDSDGEHYRELSDLELPAASCKEANGEEMSDVEMSNVELPAAAYTQDNGEEMAGVKVSDVESPVATPKTDSGVEIVAQHVTKLREEATRRNVVPYRRTLAEYIAQKESKNPLKQVDQRVPAVCYKAFNSLDTVPPIIMPIERKSGNIMSAVSMPKPIAAKPIHINGYPAQWLQPSVIRWTPGALEYLKKESKDMEVAADRAFAAEIIRVRKEVNNTSRRAIRSKGKAAANARIAPVAMMGERKNTVVRAHETTSSLYTLSSGDETDETDTESSSLFSGGSDESYIPH